MSKQTLEIGRLVIDGKTLLDLLHPVGSIFETTSSNFATVAQVQAYFGGVWEVFGAGRVIVGFGEYTDKNNLTYNFPIDQADTGEYRHTLSKNELAKHNHGNTGEAGKHTHTITVGYAGNHYHSFAFPVDYPDSQDVYQSIQREIGTESGAYYESSTGDSGTHTHNASAGEAGNHTHTTNNEGSDEAHNNLQPYVVTYRYRRTA